MNLIFDEYRYALGLIDRNEKKNFLTLKDMIILAKYFYAVSEDSSLSDVEYSLIEICKEYDPEFNEILNLEKISIALKNCKKPLRVPVSVPILETEISTIRAIKNYRFEKILFTILVLAKYYKITNPNEKGSKSKEYYINIKPSSVFRLAHTSQKKGENIFHELYKLGLLDHNLRYNSYFLKFTDTENKSNILFYIDDIKDCIRFYKPVCENCGREIEKKSNRQKMCNQCWDENRKKYNAIQKKAVRQKNVRV